MRSIRSDIVDEAELLVRRVGYSGFSYADLERSVGIRKASIHHHFPTKIDLAVALLASFDARYDAAMAAIRAEVSDGLGRVAAYAALYLDGVETGLGCPCAAFAAELNGLPDLLRSNLLRSFTKHVDWLERVLSDGIADGTIRTDLVPAQHAKLVVAVLEGSLMIERLLDGTKGFARTMATVEAMLKPVAPA